MASSTSTNEDTINNNELYKQRQQTLHNNSKLSLAPMMEYTDRHFRHLIRLLSDKTLLYTEMVAANAISHEREHAFSDLGDLKSSYLLRFLGQGYNSEGASVLQLGGSDPDQLYIASKTVYEFNQLHNMQNDKMDRDEVNPPVFCDYTALNLNCGCPSSKVAGKGCFGAALMSEPELVRQLTTSMYEGCQGSIPITVKCRIGTDDGYVFTKERYMEQSEEEEYNSLKNFVLTVADGGIVTDFQIHARIAVLGKGYSPADNRKVPPLRYHQVRRLADEFPELNISLNGGVDTLIGVKKELDDCGSLDGVMVGRGLAANPWSFAMADEVLYGTDETETKVKNRMEVLQAYGRHADFEESLWDPVKVRRFMTKAISSLFAGEANGKRYRIALDEIAGIPKQIMKQQPKGASVREAMQGQPPISELIIEAATKHLSDEVLYRSPKESYEKMLWEHEQVEQARVVFGTAATGNATNVIREWQQSRKEEEMNDATTAA
jgi:tRNA-dihydrouridine synthase A